MKARPLKLIYGKGYEPCEINEADHVELHMPGPIPYRVLPVIIKGSRRNYERPVWSWNGSTESPTIKPSILSRVGDDLVCHTWVNDGKVQFLDDCSHEFSGKTVDLLDVEE